tara:strand:- start:1178 stop:1285 length:108 start_codon:yes stop_codon:yes gene_type:complete
MFLGGLLEHKLPPTLLLPGKTINDKKIGGILKISD